jgi:hypothetical protein
MNQGVGAKRRPMEGSASSANVSYLGGLRLPPSPLRATADKSANPPYAKPDRLSAAAQGRDSKSRKTRVGELVGVAVTQFDLDPRVFDRPVYPALEIGVPHFAELIASKYAARANIISRKNAEDLASDFFIRWNLGHLLSFPHPASFSGKATGV